MNQVTKAQLEDIVEHISDNISGYLYNSTVNSIAPTLSEAVAPTGGVAEGEQFYLDNILYTATSPISQGSAIVVYPTSGYNCKLSDSVTGQIKAVKDNLGTASTKNSTSVVTQSTDLVESVAVKNIVGWGNKNLSIPYIYSTGGSEFSLSYNNNKVTVNGTLGDTDIIQPISSIARANGYMFDLSAGTYTISLTGDTANIEPQIVKSDGAVLEGTTITLNAPTTIFVRVSVKKNNTFNNQICYIQLEKGSTATAYEPYHASVNQTLRNAEVIKGKNLIGWKIGYVYSSADGSLSPNTHGACSDKIKVSAGQKFIGSKKNTLGSNDNMYARTYDSNGAFVGTIAVLSNTQLQNEITIPSNIGYIGVFQLLNSADVSREWLDSNEVMFYDATETDLTYEPYYTPLKDVVPTKTDNSVIAPVEDGATCANPNGYAVGEHFIRGGKFCTVISAIASGESFTLNTNYIEGDIADILAPKEITVTPASIYTLQSNSIAMKYGRVITINLRLNSATFSGASNYKIATIPSQYAPRVGTYSVGIEHDTNEVYRLFITNTGEIYVRLVAAATIAIEGTITYII